MPALFALALCAVSACGPMDGGFPDVAGVSGGAGPVPAIALDVVYGQKPGMPLTLDVYRPVRPNGAGVLFLNSGGYVSPVLEFVAREDGGPRLLSREEMAGERQFAVAALVEQGYTVFNVRHGTSPESVVPEIIDDVRRAVRFIQRNASEFGVDPGRLGAWGGSAGGHLALMLGTTSEMAPADTDHAPPAPLGAVVAYYPPSEWVSARKWTAGLIRAQYGADLLDVFPALAFPEALDPAISPVNHATPDDPPTLILHGDRDPLVPLEQGRLMHQALLAAGVSSELVVVEGAQHGFADGDADLALGRTLEWFDRHLLAVR